jgi:hypothetical protein
MKNFIEFLAEKDPNLLQEYIDLASLSENAWYKYLLPLMLGTQAATQAGTPTELKQRQDYNQSLKDPQDSKTEKELHSRMFAQGITIDDLNRNAKSRGFNPQSGDPDEVIGFEKFKKTNDKIDAMKLKLPHHFRPGIALNHIESNYEPEEILLRKIVNPYEIIKSTIPDPEKFQKDYNNLKSNPNDIGFAMNKDSLMHNKVLLVVVTDQAMKRVKPNAEGYAGKMHTAENPFNYTTSINTTSIDTNTINAIFLPKRAVKEIKDGKITLTDEGEKTFRHEARHTTQEGDTGERSQSANPTFKHYMNDPNEIGVRLGELKNHLSTKTLLQLTSDNPTHLNNINKLLKDVDGNEKELLKLFMAPSGQYQNTIEYIKEKLAKSNSDMGSLFKHYDELSDIEKSILMKELLDNYDNVVHQNIGQQTAARL